LPRHTAQVHLDQSTSGQMGWEGVQRVVDVSPIPHRAGEPYSWSIDYAGLDVGRRLVGKCVRCSSTTKRGGHFVERKFKSYVHAEENAGLIEYQNSTPSSGCCLKYSIINVAMLMAAIVPEKKPMSGAESTPTS
jgi:hypothetical protein